MDNIMIDIRLLNLVEITIFISFLLGAARFRVPHSSYPEIAKPETLKQNSDLAHVRHVPFGLVPWQAAGSLQCRDDCSVT